MFLKFAGTTGIVFASGECIRNSQSRYISLFEKLDETKCSLSFCRASWDPIHMSPAIHRVFESRVIPSFVPHVLLNLFHRYCPLTYSMLSCSMWMH